MRTVFEHIARSIEERKQFIICTVVHTKGSTPLKSGARMLIYADGTTVGTIGGGNIEYEAIREASRRLTNLVTGAIEYQLPNLDMCCGGSMTLFFEPVPRTKQLIIFGAGHVGSLVAFYAQKLEFNTILIDSRNNILQEADAGEAIKLHQPYEVVKSNITCDEDTYIVICTHLHQYDRNLLRYFITQPHAYLGMIGSKRKVLVTRKLFLNESVCTEQQLDRVDMPMGYDIGRNLPAEIALGIVAKMVARSNNKELFPLNYDKSAERVPLDITDCIKPKGQ